MDPSNEIAVIETRVPAINDALSVQQIAHQAALIQQAMKTVMVQGEHYGTIPGCGDRKTLLKPGAEKLCLLFRIAPKLVIEDLSGADFTRYRITCLAHHITTGEFLGEGVGECSSLEDKYAWRNVKVSDEYDEAAPEQRRKKYTGRNSRTQAAEFTLQVRTSHHDQNNTILKMAKKRALVDMALSVTAASDLFGQDLEDLQEVAARPDVGAKATGISPLVWFSIGMLARELELSSDELGASLTAHYGTSDLSALSFEQAHDLGRRLQAAVELAAAQAKPQTHPQGGK